jgi:hypothetical protein
MVCGKYLDGECDLHRQPGLILGAGAFVTDGFGVGEMAGRAALRCWGYFYPDCVC